MRDIMVPLNNMIQNNGFGYDVTLFKPIAVFCGIDNIMQNIPHIRLECEEYSIKYWQSHITLLWVWIMLWSYIATLNNIILEDPKYILDDYSL